MPSAFLFVRDGRLFVSSELDGSIRPGDDADRHAALLAMRSGVYLAIGALLPPGHPDAVIVPISTS